MVCFTVTYSTYLPSDSMLKCSTHTLQILDQADSLMRREEWSPSVRALYSEVLCEAFPLTSWGVQERSLTDTHLLRSLGEKPIFCRLWVSASSLVSLKHCQGPHSQSLKSLGDMLRLLQCSVILMLVISSPARPRSGAMRCMVRTVGFWPVVVCGRSDKQLSVSGKNRGKH